MPLIELQNIDKTYRIGDVDLPVLKDVSLTIEPGEFVALMGASGSGKTTLMNLLGCLDQPTAGSYRFDDVEVTRLSRTQLAQLRSSRIGFVFQSFNLLPRATALDNVRMPTAYAADSRPLRRVAQRSRELLAMVGLEPRLDHSPAKLSGGEQQRVAICPVAGQPATHALGRRADGQPRLAHRQGDPGAVPPPERGARDHHPAGDPRCRSGPPRRPRDSHCRRPDRGGRPHGRRRPRRPRPRPPTAGLRPAPCAAPATISAWPPAPCASPCRPCGATSCGRLLTMLGVIIGVAAVIAMMEISQGASEAIQVTVTNMGANTLVVSPGRPQRGSGGFGEQDRYAHARRRRGHRARMPGGGLHGADRRRRAGRSSTATAVGAPST